jgi:hypothetical protein
MGPPTKVFNILAIGLLFSCCHNALHSPMPHPHAQVRMEDCLMNWNKGEDDLGEGNILQYSEWSEMVEGINKLRMSLDN